VRLAETRWAAAVVFVVSLAVWWLEAAVIPLGPGRDLGTYLGGYIQLFQAHPIDLGYVLGRTPIAMLVVGGLLDLAGGALAEPVMSVLYSLSIVAWFLAARTFGVRAALLVVVLLLLYPGYGILFHELSSDAVFAAAFAGWSLLVVRVLRAPTFKGWALAGAGVGVLALIRPGNQIMLALALVPFVLRSTWRRRVISAAAFVVPAVVLIGGWTIHNGIRYDNYTIARGGNATVPFYRAFVTDRIVRPSNGPASRELARAVQTDLLPKQPYRAYGITLADFFDHPSSRMQVDLLALSDRIKGWHSNYRWLRDVGTEAVEKHPATYARGVAKTVWQLLTQAVYRTPTAPDSSAQTHPAAVQAAPRDGPLPVPTEGEPIPAPHEGGVTTPDFSIYTVWTSPTKHHLVFVHPGDEQRYVSLHARMNELAANLPDRRGSPTLAHRLNQASRWLVPPILWLAIAIFAFVYRRPRGAVELLVPALAGLMVILISALGLPSEPHYSVPVVPAFVLLAGGALFAPRGAWAWRWRRVATPAGVVLGAVAAVWGVKHYVDGVRYSFTSHTAPHDLDVFLRASGKVIHFASPYAYQADVSYAYPPLLAYLVAPLYPLATAVATLFWTLVCLGSIAAALWLLGVRDWRCYALTAAYPMTRSAVDLGTVGPLLLLAVAAAWHWRDRVVEPALAGGAAIALKLFLWPLVAWLGITRRLLASAGAVVATGVLVLLPWAVMGFAGIGDFPGLLRHLSDDEATSSYSVDALVVRAHLPEALGITLGLVLALALLVVAWLAERRTVRNADAVVLTLCLAAALAASPIVWVHYFLLLVVPLALAQPRLSWLWLVPFAYEPLGESAWPAGDAGKLVLALVTTVVILGGLLTTMLRKAGQPVFGAASLWPLWRPLPRARSESRPG
jgi:Glycosyltransferase family 87/Dolichyl-phosphate-mannose-protein mannosyltransferase